MFRSKAWIARQYDLQIRSIFGLLCTMAQSAYTHFWSSFGSRFRQKTAIGVILIKDPLLKL